MRRVMRRVQVCRLETLTEYAEHLRTSPEEAQSLFSDLLISVTQFFRDGAAFQALATHAIRPIFDAVPNDGIRAWVAGEARADADHGGRVLLEGQHPGWG